VFEQIISAIKPLDTEAMEKCQLRLDNLTKPLNSLQAFETLARQLAGITGVPRPRDLPKSIIIMAGDHGVAAEIGAYPEQTTTEKIATYCQSGAAINVFAEHVAADLVLVDIGVATDLPLSPLVRHEKLAYGTKNIVRQLAMTREQVLRAIETGIKIAREETNKGSRVIGLGEISIANDISSLAIIACYSSKTLAELTGQVNEIADECLNRKIHVLETALSVNCPDKDNPLDILMKLGGLEIAGLVGVILGAAAGGAAVVLDGLASSAAALIAVKMAPQVKDYLVGSHFSGEPAHKEALEIINVPAYLYLDLYLGEGTGAALGMSLINASLHVLNDMKTFGEAEVAVAQDGPGALKQSKDIKN